MMGISKVVDGNIQRIDPRDYGSSQVGDIPVIEKHEFPKFNQYKDKRSKSACTIVNSVKDLCYNYGIDFKTDYVFGAIDYAVKNDGYVIGKGWHTDSAMKSVRKYFKTLGVESNYVRIRYTDPKLQEYKDKGYMIGCSFSGNSAYILDYAKDGILDGTKYTPKKFGHRTSMYGDNRVWDSEYGLKYNDYKLKDWNGLIKYGTFNGWYYIWILPDTLTKPMEEIKTDLEKEKELTILENALSICRKHLNDENKQKAHDLAEYIRDIK